MNKVKPISKKCYPNLERAIIENGISKNQIADFLGIKRRTLTNRLSGITAFTVNEACKLQQHYFPDIDIPELFKKN